MIIFCVLKCFVGTNLNEIIIIHTIYKLLLHILEDFFKTQDDLDRFQVILPPQHYWYIKYNKSIAWGFEKQLF